jgi:hypothetical protein
MLGDLAAAFDQAAECDPGLDARAQADRQCCGKIPMILTPNPRVSDTGLDLDIPLVNGIRIVDDQRPARLRIRRHPDRRRNHRRYV